MAYILAMLMAGVNIESPTNHQREYKIWNRKRSMTKGEQSDNPVGNTNRRPERGTSNVLTEFYLIFSYD